MQGGILTEDDLEKYFTFGECPRTSLVVPPPSSSHDRQQPHSTTLGVGGPSLTNRYSSGPPSYAQWVYRIPEACIREARFSIREAYEGRA